MTNYHSRNSNLTSDFEFDVTNSKWPPFLVKKNIFFNILYRKMYCTITDKMDIEKDLGWKKANLVSGSCFYNYFIIN